MAGLLPKEAQPLWKAVEDRLFPPGEEDGAVLARPDELVFRFTEAFYGDYAAETFENVKQIKTRGPGFFMRSHENTRYAFTDSMMSKEHKNKLQIIDKQTLEVVKEIEAPAGQTLAHVEFTKDGRYALASLWEMDGALVVIDMNTLTEVKRIPAKKPVGKYNVWNKITRSEGTSH